MRRVLVAVAALAAVAAVGCDAAEGDLVVAGTAPPTPYSGPLHIPGRGWDEEKDDRSGLVNTGAAARALECDWPIGSAGGSEPWSEGDGGETPEEGLKAYFAIEQPGVPREGYRVEREEGGRTAAASGCRSPVISSSAGSAHCDWQDAHFLGLGEGGDGKIYARDPHGALGDDMLTVPYEGDVRLPAGAQDTGYRRGDWQLWLTADRGTAYVRTPDGVEAWPRGKGKLCA